MKTKIVLLQLLLFASVLSVAQSKQEQHVIQLSNKKFDWLMKKQMDSLASMLDSRLQYIHSNGWIQSKEDVLADLNSGKMVYKNVTVDDVNARAYKNTIVVIGKGQFAGSVEDRSFELKLLYTEVYVLNKNKWMLVSRHANRID